MTTPEEFEEFCRDHEAWLKALKERGIIVDYNMKIDASKLSVNTGVQLKRPLDFVAVDIVETMPPKDQVATPLTLVSPCRPTQGLLDCLNRSSCGTHGGYYNVGHEDEPCTAAEGQECVRDRVPDNAYPVVVYWCRTHVHHHPLTYWESFGSCWLNRANQKAGPAKVFGE